MTGISVHDWFRLRGVARRVLELRFAALLAILGLLFWAVTGFPIGAPEYVAGDLGQMAREAIWALAGQFFAGTALLAALALLCAPITPPWAVRMLDYFYYALAAAGVVLFFVADYGTRWDAQKEQRVPELRQQIDALQAKVDKFTAANTSRALLRDGIQSSELATLEAETRRQRDICAMVWQPKRIEIEAKANDPAAPRKHPGLAAELQACARASGLATMFHAVNLAETEAEAMPRLPFIVTHEIDAAVQVLKAVGAEPGPLLTLIAWHDAEVTLREKRALLDEYMRARPADQDRRSLAFLRFIRYEWWVLVALGALALKLTKTTIEMFGLTRDAVR